MPRDERIEAILAAWHEMEECAPPEKAKRRDERNKLIEEVTATTRSSRQELLEALGSRFVAYRVACRKEHQAKMARILRQP
ncbi:MAG: hypothetical protein ABSH34_15130 [Verrucomicrobiota bacterium]